MYTTRGDKSSPAVSESTPNRKEELAMLHVDLNIILPSVPSSAAQIKTCSSV
jgi:hypothetical protein